MQQLDGEMGRLNDVVDTEADTQVRSFSLARTDAIAPETQLQGHLTIRDVAFQFSHTTPRLFGGLGLDLAAGQHLAIVGGSGSGKSTLLRVLSGLMQPTEGTILYDGRPWMAWDDASLRRSLALVSQDVFLFRATLFENLTLWDPRFSQTEALTALRDAGLLEELGGQRPCSCSSWRAAAISAAGSANGWRSLGPCFGAPACCSWMKPPVPSISGASARFLRQ
jgi:ATP-binding cassette subfamily B protein